MKPSIFGRLSQSGRRTRNSATVGTNKPIQIVAPGKQVLSRHVPTSLIRNINLAIGQAQPKINDPAVRFELGLCTDDAALLSFPFIGTACCGRDSLHQVFIGVVALRRPYLGIWIGLQVNVKVP